MNAKGAEQGGDFTMKLRLMISTAMAVVGFASPVFAQSALPSTPEAEADENIIAVTAQKKSENLQDVPIAVSAISGQSLEDRQINDVLDMQSLAPGLQVSTMQGTARVFVRGIGLTNFSPGAESSVAFHVNGAVISRPSAQIGSFYDLERIEVLRGPQGSLYGRNATGGSINLITRRPRDEFEGYADLTVGNYGLMGSEGALNVPIIRNGLAARIAFNTENRDGYGHDPYTGQDIDDANSQAVRVSLAVGGTGDFTAFATYSHYSSHPNGSPQHAFGPGNPYIVPPELAQGGMLAADPRDPNSEVRFYDAKTVDSATLELNWRLSDSVSLRSLSNYLDYHYRFNFDLNGTPVQFFAADLLDASEQYSQEFQLTADTGRLSSMLGLYYFHEDIVADLTVHGPPVYTNVFKRPFIEFNGNQSSESYAVFLNETFELSDTVTVIGGLRYSADRKEDEGFNTIPTGVSIPLKRRANWNAWTPKLVLQYQPTRDLMAYATVARGYKAGVINIGSAGDPVNPEFVWNYEAGIKSELFDRRLTLNAAVFYTTITDLQVQRPINGTLITVNAAKASTKGIELEATGRIGGGLSADLGVSILEAKFDEFITRNTTFVPLSGSSCVGQPMPCVDGDSDLAGNYLPNAPRLTLAGAFNFDTEFASGWGLNARVQGIYTSKRYFNEFNEAIAMQDSTFQLNANLKISLPGDHVSLNFWGRNLTDEFILSHINVTSRPIGHMRTGTILPPRIFGATLGFKF